MPPKPAELSVALLRGINVGGKNILPMKALAAIFTAAGCTDVKTYIQSGNVIFQAHNNPDLPAFIRAEIESQFQLKIPVVIRTASELRHTIDHNPFFNAGVDPALLHVMFLETAPTAAQIGTLDRARSIPDEFAVIRKDIYLRLPSGAAKTRLTNAYFDSKLKTVSTQRNWRTVLTLAGMSSTLLK